MVTNGHGALFQKAWVSLNCLFFLISSPCLRKFCRQFLYLHCTCTVNSLSSWYGRCIVVRSIYSNPQLHCVSFRPASCLCLPNATWLPACDTFSAGQTLVWMRILSAQTSMLSGVCVMWMHSSLRSQPGQSMEEAGQIEGLLHYPQIVLSAL